MVLSEGKCNIYEVSIDNNDPPPFTESFLTSVTFLNDTKKRGPYEYFIKLYGTHYFISMHMGAKYVHKLWFTNNTWRKMEHEVNSYVILKMFLRRVHLAESCLRHECKCFR